LLVVKEENDKKRYECEIGKGGVLEQVFTDERKGNYRGR